MEEVSPVPAVAHESVGDSLRLAREQQGLDLSEIASRTRVPLRHLEALEAGSYNSLPSPTYATGFVKAYARAVGLDEVAITRRVRDELANSGPRAPEYQPYQAPDPARVPSRGLAVVTLGIAIAIIILAGLWYGGILQRNGATTVAAPAADAPIAAAPATGAAPAPVPGPSAAPPTGGQVVLETTDRVWLRVHDGDRTLYIGTMNPGERFDVPADAQNPLVDIGRPDKLKVTLDGSALPPLPASDRPMKGLRVGAAAVAARLAGQVAPPADPAPGPTAAATATTATATVPRRPTAARSRARPRPQPRDETARANLEAARNPPPPAATP